TDIDAAQVSQAPGIGKDTSLADFNRSRAAAVFSHFGKTPYWQRTDKHGSKSDESADPSSKGPAFASLDDLERMPLQDAAGKELGRIEDFAIAVKTGLIAYAAVVLNDKPQDQLYPLPLSAFVVRPSAKQWVVELTPELIEQTHSIGTGDWPQKVDRAWVEYVHVRYGLSVFSGVRTKLHAIGTKGN
ncbi:MAG TPA: PRC-barrel domain-containing protein, partial [Pirellulales bacterium]|nr:PRC-barrel domain-containing protein [Pirellulales bacterium]